MNERVQTHTMPPTQRSLQERDYEDIFLAWEAAVRRAESTQVTYHGGKFRVRMITRDADAVCYHHDLGVAMELALERVGAL